MDRVNVSTRPFKSFVAKMVGYPPFQLSRPRAGGTAWSPRT